MKTEQIVFSETNGWISKSALELKSKAQLILLFGNKDLLKNKQNIDFVINTYPAEEVVGCSTSGEITGEEIFENNIICTAIWFEKTRIQIAKEQIGSMEESFSIGEKLANSLMGEQLAHILVLSEGLNINGSELISGINTSTHDEISVSGGLAGDQDNFSETVIVHNGAGKKNLVLAIGFYGENIKVGCGSMGGWDSFGVDRLITKSDRNILYELDNQPALELYKKYLGHHADNLPLSALLFPLSILKNHSETSLVRTVLGVNEADGSMVFAGDIPQGEYVRLMKTNIDKLVEGAYGAAKMALASLQDTMPDLAILISCVGRKLVMKQRVEEELDAVREELGMHANISGFYSYGEISPTQAFEQHCELHNQTMTITLFKEN